MLTRNFYGKTYPISFVLNRYMENDNLYVGMVTEIDGCTEFFGDLTVNLSVPCKENRAFIDSNNNGRDIIDWLVENELGYMTWRMERSGFCEYYEFCFDMDKVKEHLFVEE